MPTVKREVLMAGAVMAADADGDVAAIPISFLASVLASEDSEEPMLQRAQAAALQNCRAKFLPADGWRQHRAVIARMPDHVVLRAARGIEEA